MTRAARRLAVRAGGPTPEAISVVNIVSGRGRPRRTGQLVAVRSRGEISWRSRGDLVRSRERTPTRIPQSLARWTQSHVVTESLDTGVEK